MCCSDWTLSSRRFFFPFFGFLRLSRNLLKDGDSCGGRFFAPPLRKKGLGSSRSHVRLGVETLNTCDQTVRENLADWPLERVGYEV